MSSLFVGNLSSHVRHRELENVFRRFGRSNLELKDGFGFVIYEEHRDAKRALEALRGKSICGEQLSISWARKRRPFQRYTGRSNFGSRDNYQSRRKSSLETDQGSEDGRRDEKFLGDVKDTNEFEARTAEREGEWKESGPEKPGFDEEVRDVDPLDSGRWEPKMDSSPENMMVDGLLENAEHAVHDKDRDNEKAHDKPHGSVDRHFGQSSRGYRNSSDQHKRGRDTFAGRGQERCYICGQSGHVKWQCRSRPKRISMQSRDSYDPRRNDSRYFGARGGFRGGGRFRGGMNGSRRMLPRDVDAGFAKRGLRRHDPTGDRRRYDPVDTKVHEKDRQRRRRSESPKDSSSRGRNKRKHKKQSKKSAQSSKKRRRSSSSESSPSSSSRSTRSSSTNSTSGSRSQSATSGSRSSTSGSHSSSSQSHSEASPSQSSRSRSSSASSTSRSRSASSRSGKSPTKSRSRSVSSRSQRSRGISLDSPKSKREHSSHSSSPRRGSRSSIDKADKDMAVSHKHEDAEREAASEPAIDDGTEDRDDWRYSSEEHDTDGKREERRRAWSREAKKQENQRRDSEEPHSKAVLQSNGVKHGSSIIKSEGGRALTSPDGTANETFSEDLAGRKASELLAQSQMVDTKHSLYAAFMEEGSGGTGGQSSGQKLTTSSFGAARLWPWEAMLYRRINRGPISTANYERRKAQNEEFGIKDTFVRSSSGWWETQKE